MYNIYGAVNLIIASHTLFWLILVSRIQHGLGKQLSKILIKKWKSSSVSSVSCDQELNIAPNPVNKKKALCMDVTRVNDTKSNGYWCRKVGYLRRQEAKTVVFESRRVGVNGG